MTEPTFTTSDDNRRLEARVSFNADAPLTLSASNASGRVDVSTDRLLPAGTIQVAAIRTDNSEFDDDDHHFTVKVDGNTVSIHPDWQFASGVSGLARRIRDQLQHGFRPEDWNLSRLKLSPELDFNIIVTLPASLAEGSQVKLRTASGEVDIRDITAGASIVTASGDVDARDLTGTVAIHTASGDVEVTNVTESLEVNTASGDVAIRGGDAWLAARSASGDVAIRGMQLRNTRITTVSGDIAVEATFDNTAASYGMETVSGDVSITATLPGHDTNATLGFGTLSGSSSVAGEWEKRKRREWHIGEGERGLTINVKTVSGDLAASARRDAAVAARALAIPVREPDADDETFDDFKSEMKAFGKEMKQLGKEMKHFGHGGGLHGPGDGAPPTPPVPPAPPAPPAGSDEQTLRDYEQRLKDHEQRLRDHEQRNEERRREHEERHRERELEREQRQREKAIEREERQREKALEREERRREREVERADRHGTPQESPIFTAGPSGVDFRRDTVPVEASESPAPAQPTEPVAPPAQFNQEDTMTETQTPETGTRYDAETQTARSTGTTPTPIDPRLRVLEALEKGEIDIEDALAQLETERNGGAAPR